ncbi:MAG TPA: zinc ABC transporter substrate-binding protein [Candidatus Thermoplasmatota archaeon]|nr:zinc ABC transporter substrate-binding protein [Candidatus Thermoplasmatota archaeon]
MASMPSRLALVAVVLVAAGCVGPAPAPRDDIVASFYPVQFLAERIAGDDLAVGVLVSAGVEPHEYDLRPSDVARLGAARLVLLHGADLEGFASEVATATAKRGVPVATVTEGIDLRKAIEEGEEVDDPHVWLDPVLFAEEAKNALAAIEAADPANATAHRARAATLAADLATLADAYEAGLAMCKKRAIITTHAAFGYVAARYNFTEHSVSGLEPEAEPSAEAVRAASDLARRENITVIFFETLVSPKVAQVIANEIGGEARVLNPIEGLTDEEAARGEDYFSIMRQNLAALRHAMECA